MLVFQSSAGALPRLQEVISARSATTALMRWCTCVGACAVRI